jgi:hypothetical protein
MASSAKWSATVPELTVTACEQPIYFPKSTSNYFTFEPVVSHRERKVSTTASISPSVGFYEMARNLDSRKRKQEITKEITVIVEFINEKSTTRTYESHTANQQYSSE